MQKPSCQGARLLCIVTNSDLEGPLIEFDRGQNQVAVDGGGQLTVPVANAGVGLESFDLA